MSLPERLMQREYAHVQHLRIAGCNNLTFIFKSQLPSSLKKLEVEYCGKLQYLFDDDTRASINNTGLSSLEHLHVSNCLSLTRMSSRMEQLSVLKHLVISECPNLVTLSSSGQLPETLQNLHVSGCPNLKSIAESFQSNMSLENIKIWECEELKLLPGN
ncbi:hypothetical protein EZV62_009338 [Acer yangbiense]|uniref:NB-ARC domain-containing protein n=1 Tax=Acer yangbiense TaxID=1000413 RepID=A0A5C7IFQ7_9ROSI|nr:hypothetical protein EZV62_009338 [Acer yangbiense]